MNSEVKPPDTTSYTSITVSPDVKETSWWQKDCRGMKHLICCKLNVLLFALPVGLLSMHYKWSSACVFGFNFLAIIPLASILGNCTEMLAEHTGQLIGGLVNATFGNAVEMIITIQAIKNGLLEIVQGSLLGSILSNLLLVLGMSFAFGGMVFVELDFNIVGAAAQSSLLILACMGIALPTFFSQVPNASEEATLAISRICALCMACMYVLFLIFQLKTHKEFFVDNPAPEGWQFMEQSKLASHPEEAQGGQEFQNVEPGGVMKQKSPRRSLQSPRGSPLRKQMSWVQYNAMDASADDKGNIVLDISKESTRTNDTKEPLAVARNMEARYLREDTEDAVEAEEEEAGLSIGTALLFLGLTTVIVSICSEGMVDSIEIVSSQYGLPKAFIGLILIPIVGNASEHLTAVVAAYKGKMDLALGVAVGSSTQIALFVVPFAVIIGWAYDQPMTLNFRSFDTAVMIFCVFLVVSTLNDGTANWLEGCMLLATYVMVAAICCYIPENK